MPHHAISEHTQYVLERDRWEAELALSRQHRDDEPIHKTAAPAQDPPPAPDEYSGPVLVEALGEVIASERRDVREALEKRDREIKLLRRQVRALQDEVDLRLKLADELSACRGEIEELRQRAPSYKSELASLRETVEKQAKLITRLRGQMSQVDYAQRQLEAAQRKDRYEATLTVTQLSAVGSATREVLDRLRAEGVDFEEWAPMGLAS